MHFIEMTEHHLECPDRFVIHSESIKSNIWHKERHEINVHRIPFRYVARDHIHAFCQAHFFFFVRGAI